MPRFSSEYQPKKRGKAPKTKILEAMKRQGKTEDGFYDLLVQQAFDGEDLHFAEILKRINPVPKAVAPLVEFEFTKDASPSVRANEILDAVSKGLVNPDIGSMLISSVKALVDIEEITDLRERIESIEQALNAASNQASK